MTRRRCFSVGVTSPAALIRRPSAPRKGTPAPSPAAPCAAVGAQLFVRRPGPAAQPRSVPRSAAAPAPTDLIVVTSPGLGGRRRRSQANDGQDPARTWRGTDGRPRRAPRRAGSRGGPRAAGDAGRAGDHADHRAGAVPAAVAADQARLPARADRIRRRGVFRRRAAADPRRGAVQGLHHRPAARGHAADDAGRVVRRAGRHRQGPVHRPGADRLRRGGGGNADRPAHPAPRGAGGGRGRRVPGRLPGRGLRGAHRADRAVAGAVLPGRSAGRAGRRPPDQQRAAAGGRRRRVRVRGRVQGVGHPPGDRAGDPAAEAQASRVAPGGAAHGPLPRRHRGRVRAAGAAVRDPGPAARSTTA